MAKPILSKRKSDVIANGVFLIGLGILFYSKFWWPGILLVLWSSIALRQYFTGRVYDLFLSSFILLGLFVVIFFDFEWNVLMPVLLIVGGIYIIFREYFFAEVTNLEEKPQEIRDDTK